jgi:hypothetical protein
MFQNVALDVFIGLIFIFLLYSLLASIVQEIIAHFLDLRARMLVKTIRVMLDDRHAFRGNVLARFIGHIRANLDHFFCPLKRNRFSRVFYQHPSVKYLAQDSWRSKPAYMSAYTFSSTLMKVLRGKEYNGAEPQMAAISRTLFETGAVSSGQGANSDYSVLGPETADQLQQLYLDAHKDADRFRALLEQWYDEAMDRASGWYKKQTQIILFFIGLSLAVLFNVDTLALCTILSKDDQARDQLVAMAISSAGKYDTLTKQMGKVHITDSAMLVTTKDGVADTAWTVRSYDTLLMGDKQLQDAYQMVLSDIHQANYLMGLGRGWKDSCLTCDGLRDSIGRSNLSARDKELFLLLLQTDGGGKLCDGDCVKRGKWLQYHPLQAGGFITLLGWVLTALAISIGAPFWFDMLNKVIRMRASGPKPRDDPAGGPAAGGSAPGAAPTERVG